MTASIRLLRAGTDLGSRVAAIGVFAAATFDTVGTAVLAAPAETASSRVIPADENRIATGSLTAACWLGRKKPQG
jgi:hypothetical protein